MEIRRVAGEAEEKQFVSLLQYCFQEHAGKDFFPLKGGVVAWGAFDGDRLTAGVVEVPFDVHLLDGSARMLGIGGVASFPEYRNSGAVRSLHKEILSTAKGKGYLVSTLYPFSFDFYQKFGYGNLGPCNTNRFATESIRHTRLPNGCRIQEPDPAELAEAIRDSWLAGFFSRYDLSDARDAAGVAKGLSDAVSNGLYLRSCHDRDGVPVGVILYAISTAENWQRTFKIERIAWKDGNAFRGLMAFVWSHRGQCATVEWNWPDEAFIPATLQEPRYDRRPHYYWMGRPVDVPAVLARKAAYHGFAGELSFSLDDPCIPANSGRYTVTGDKIDFEPGGSGKDLPFHFFSSMLLGRMTPEEVSLQAPLPFDAEAASALFQPRQVYITERF